MASDHINAHPFREKVTVEVRPSGAATLYVGSIAIKLPVSRAEHLALALVQRGQTRDV